MDDIQDQIHDQYSRRTFLGKTSAGLGALALASLLNPNDLFAGTPSDGVSGAGALGKPHFPPKVKRVIYLFQSCSIISRNSKPCGGRTCPNRCVKASA